MATAIVAQGSRCCKLLCANKRAQVLALSVEMKKGRACLFARPSQRDQAGYPDSAPPGWNFSHADLL